MMVAMQTIIVILLLIIVALGLKSYKQYRKSKRSTNHSSKTYRFSEVPISTAVSKEETSKTVYTVPREDQPENYYSKINSN